MPHPLRDARDAKHYLSRSYLDDGILLEVANVLHSRKNPHPDLFDKNEVPKAVLPDLVSLRYAKERLLPDTETDLVVHSINVDYSTLSSFLFVKQNQDKV